VNRPLNELGEADLCPGQEALKQVDQSLR